MIICRTQNGHQIHLRLDENREVELYDVTNNGEWTRFMCVANKDQARYLAAKLNMIADDIEVIDRAYVDHAHMHDLGFDYTANYETVRYNPALQDL